MKKIMVGIIFIKIVFTIVVSYAYAEVNTIELNFKVVNNEKEEKFDLYLLLPESYISFATENNSLDIPYDGDELYKEDGIEYIQVLLEPNEEGIYSFELLENYPRLDMKYRIKNEKKDYILHIDNFKVKKGTCEIRYDYDKDIVKQPDEKVINGTMVLFILLVSIIIIGIISHIRRR